ncbi:hypothetical protein K3152_09285 [Qipengyuania sp. 1NDH17]|uniref:HdeD family acid-resistance protein n=1 Tax=Qipengyuania polymorpha TaxID=2867234 RepID=A0ABS7IXZ6_9SPHN|nr:hypothetical protein [Qipengyuania polymorpha]MBX7458437.1 hypothetical protein [Qipengyuania polymorpha]
MTDTKTPWLNGWRIAGWGALLALLALPAVAMQFTREANWSGGDFVFAAILLGLLGGGVELAFRIGRSGLQAAAIALFTLLSFLTLWSNMAVGIIGAESEPVNGGFTLAVFAAIVLALVFKFRPAVMRGACLALAILQPILGLVAAFTMPGHGVEWGVLGVFAALWAIAALLFRKACAD